MPKCLCSIEYRVGRLKMGFIPQFPSNYATMENFTDILRFITFKVIIKFRKLETFFD